MFRFVTSLFRGDKDRGVTGVAADTLDAAGNDLQRILILSAEKKNQNYYRDLELAHRSRALFLSERFDWQSRSFSIRSVVDEYFAGTPPDWIFLNYNHSYTWQLGDIDGLNIPVVGFVGDHYDFTDDAPRSRVKQEYFRSIEKLAALVTAYPHTNDAVVRALGRPGLPVIHLPWGVDDRVFYDMGLRRTFDIACLGALTEGKYPLRRTVRNWIEKESGLRYIRKTRIGGHDGDQFNRALNTTYSAFTCASVFGYTLMKYFEIPASGALMFAETTPDLAALGFRDGVHYVEVDESTFADRIRHFTSTSGREEGERIRQQGRTFVVENHTWSKRIPPFLSQVAELPGVKRTQ